MTREQFISRTESTQKAFRGFLTALCCGDTALADDIAQEAYIKAWLCSDSLADEARFKAWLFRIGYNTFLNSRRAEKPLARYDEAATVAAADGADSAFRYQRLYAALNLLPRHERSSVLLFYLEGYTTDEIAEIEQISSEAVRQHLSRGRKRLRSLLGTEN